jgi:hypothetical protein
MVSSYGIQVVRVLNVRPSLEVAACLLSCALSPVIVDQALLFVIVCHEYEVVGDLVT